jgi:hypothetical protein
MAEKTTTKENFWNVFELSSFEDLRMITCMMEFLCRNENKNWYSFLIEKKNFRN